MTRPAPHLRSDPRRTDGQAHCPVAEPLEGRRLCAANPTAGVLTVSGTAGSDTILIAPAGAGVVRVTIDGSATTYRSAQIGTIRLTVTTDDSVTVTSLSGDGPFYGGRVPTVAIAGRASGISFDAAAAGDTVRLGTVEAGPTIADAGTRVTTDGATFLGLVGGAGNDVLDTRGYAATGAGATSTFVRGGAGNDTLYGSANSVLLDGGTGNDLIEAAEGHGESVLGGDGVDTVAADAADTVIEAEVRASPPDARLTGTTIGTAGSWAGRGNTIARATDGNLATFFDGPVANGDWVGLDLGYVRTIRQIAFAPRAGYADRMVGGKVQVSTTADFSAGVTTVYTVTATPASGRLTTVTLPSAVTARFVRFLSPTGGYGDIAEFQARGY